MLAFLRTQAIRVYVLLVLSCLRVIARLVPAGVAGRPWLIGENRGDPHKDNGYCLFRHCVEQGHDHVYFVVHHDAANYDDFLRHSPRVLRYGSPHHLWVFARAGALLYTHTYRDLIYPRFFPLAAPGRKLVFLQHGVTAFKRFHPLYQQTCNDMDLLLAVSGFERDILTQQVGTEPGRVQVTGFPRFDYLEDTAGRDGVTRILYFPTWRDWIDDSNIAGSVFLAHVRSLLASQRLRDLLDAPPGGRPAELVVCLHGRMRAHVSHLLSAHPRIRVVGFGEQSVQALLAQASLLVTDYSSVSWDFLYMGKPVVFYAFDSDDYLRLRGTYVPLDPPPFGERVITEDALIDTLRQRLAAGCLPRPEDVAAKVRFFAFHDRDHSQRVYAATRELCHG